MRIKFFTICACFAVSGFATLAFIVHLTAGAIAAPTPCPSDAIAARPYPGAPVICIKNPYNVEYKVKNKSGTVLKVLWHVNGASSESKSFSLGQSVSTSFPAADHVVVQLLTYVSDRAGTASGSGFISVFNDGSPATHGCWLSRSSGWNSMTVDVTGPEGNITCKISGHTTSSDPHYAF